jgi:NAD(P)-dependent dehydrogenase (short-subunit alcohol dehydrogenase family)
MSRLIWCTGAGKGIGRALSLRLARDGHTVAASARTVSDLESLASQSAGLPGRIVAFPLDVTDEAAVAATVAAIEDALGPIDIAVLNAGTHIPVAATELTSPPFRTLFEVNVMGVVHGLCALLPVFIARRSGHIAVVASVAGYRGLPTAAAYGASKAAVINMCEALQPELTAVGVRLTLINPGFVKTPLTDKNDFEMPLLMEVDAAADRIADGLRSSRFEVTFPRRFTWMLKLLRILPYPLYFFLVRKFLVRP